MLTDNNIRDAVKMWFNPKTRQEAIDKFGHIGDWEVMNVTDMSGLFEGQKEFNENISRWNTTNVTTMHRMFAGASSFNQPVEGLNTASVIDMRYMFSGAFKQHPSWFK